MKETIGMLAPASLVIPFIDTNAAYREPEPNDTENQLDLGQMLQPHPGNNSVLQIKGDSMQDANMPHGSWAVADRMAKPASGSIVVAMLDNELTVKRLVKAGRNWVLHPENAFYKPVIITEEMDFRVLGVITHVIVDLRK